MEIKIKISLLLKKCTKVVIYLMECDMLLHVLLAMHNFDFFFFFKNRAWSSSSSGKGPELEIEARFMSSEWSGKVWMAFAIFSLPVNFSWTVL